MSAIRRCPLLAPPLLGAFTVYTSEVSIELQTSVAETNLHLFEVFPYVYLFRLIHDIQSLFVMLNNLSYIP